MFGLADHVQRLEHQEAKRQRSVPVVGGRDAGVWQRLALAWVRASGALPLVGARTSAQVAYCLGEVVLPPEAVARLEAAAPFERGFPADFMAECEASPFSFGGAVVR